MRLSSKLSIVIATGITCILVVAAVSIGQSWRIRATNTMIVDNHLPSIIVIGDMIMQAEALQGIALEMLVRNEDPTLTRLGNELDTLTQSIRKLALQYQQSPAEWRPEASAQTVSNNLDRALVSLGEMQQSARLHDITSARQQWPQVEKDFQRLLDGLKALDDMTDHNIDLERAKAERAYRQGIQMTLIIALLMTGMMAALTVWAYRSIARPLKQLEQRIVEIGGSQDFSGRIDLVTRNEVRNTTDALNMLLDRVQTSMAEIRAQRDQIAFLANHDHLTGLPVWRLTSDRLRLAIEAARRHNESVALLFIDLDGFKLINDSYGHDAGDHVLKSVAQRLTHVIRSEDTAARMGGDEFIVILARQQDLLAAERVSRAILAQLQEPLPYGQLSLRIGASIGIASWPAHGDSIDALVKAADRAMYLAKQAGKNRYVIASPVQPPPSCEQLSP